MLSQEDAIARVARGAAHLDSVRPGWWDQIDTGLLELSSCHRCIAAQLVTGVREFPFTAGLVELGLDNGKTMDNARVVEHGMGLGPGDCKDSEGAPAFALLQDAWIAAICDRRLAHVAPVTQAATEPVRA